MPLLLQLATNETIDALIAVASRYFFDGSEPVARGSLGPFDESETGFFLAYEKEDPVAVVTVRYFCNYPPFRERGIPFIQNIEVRYERRGQGLGRLVLEAIENWLAVNRGATEVGICVGLDESYGPAQRLYAKCGYVPDGRGACEKFTPLLDGQNLTLGHDHLLWLTKERRKP